MEKRKPISITRLLIQYAAACIITVLAVLIVWWMLVTLGISTGFVTQANAGEEAAKAAAQAMEANGSFDEALVPPLCGYVLFDKTGSVVQTSLSGKRLEAAITYFNNNINTNNYYHQNALFDDVACVLQYRINNEYRSAALRRVLPDFETTLLSLMLIIMCAVLCLFTAAYVRRFKRCLAPLQEAVLQIANGTLDGAPQQAPIKEYNDVLNSIETLKTSLKASLNKQWSMEHEKYVQTSALAHDLRTPLTVIDGNAQLLVETPLTDEQTQYVNATLRSVQSAQQYIDKLNEIIKAENAKPECESVNGDEFISRIKAEAQDICTADGAKLSFSAGEMPALNINANDVCRAVINIVQNAAERSSAVNISCAYADGFFTAQISDNGGGFSKEAIARARERFYTENAARTQNGHQGIGLAFADETAKKYGGTLDIKNISGGACVKISVKA